jgi:hypothetical protein
LVHPQIVIPVELALQFLPISLCFLLGDRGSLASEQGAQSLGGLSCPVSIKIVYGGYSRDRATVFGDNETLPSLRAGDELGKPRLGFIGADRSGGGIGSIRHLVATT